jgi:hypothetical protein
MRETPFLITVVALLAACAPKDRAGCSVSTDCPTGEYCARTPNGNICWPDSIPPTVSGVTVTCAQPCLRNSELQIEATVEDNTEVLDAQVTLDVGGPAVPLVHSGSTWSATVPLRQLPFDYFTHGVMATVTARDGARNVTSMDAEAVTTVTRMLWELSIGSAIAPPAVSGTGILAVPTNSGKTYLVAWDGDFVASVQTGSNLQQPTAALANANSFWLANDGGAIFELTESSGWTLAFLGSTGDQLKGSLASTSGGTVIAVSEGGVVYAVTSSVVRNSGPVSPFAVGAVVDETDAVFAVAGGTAYRFVLSPGGIPVETWASPVSLGANVPDPFACTTELYAVADTGSAGVLRTLSLNGEPQFVTTTARPSSGLAILSDGSIVVPEQTKTLSRWTSTGSAFPGWQTPVLSGAAETPLVMTGSTPFIVPTASGGVHALYPDGTMAWWGPLSPGTTSLQPGNLYTPPGQPPGQEVSVAYFAGSDGWLHAVLVDGILDGAAPWPKAFHDPQNTNRAGPQP